MSKSVDDILQRFREIEGFQAVGVYSTNGELIAQLNQSENYKLDNAGNLTNSVLMNTQKAADELNVGAGNRTIITTNEATIITQTYNEGENPVQEDSGKVQFNIIAIFEQEIQLAVTKMKIDKIVYEIAPYVSGSNS